MPVPEDCTFRISVGELGALGLDPGLRFAGWGAAHVIKNNFNGCCQD